MKNKIICVSGYFNPLHSGHISLMREAKKLGDYLIVIINSDKQVELKGSIPFMDEKERLEIVKNIRWVDEAIISIDEDKTVCRSLEKINPHIFANGGDRKNMNDIPEAEICKKLGIEMVFNVGGNEKSKASSVLIKDAVDYYLKNKI